MTWSSPTVPWTECDEERRELVRVCWSAGDLSYKLDPAQDEIYRAIRSSHERIEESADRWWLLDIGRRWGKDFLMACMAVETCLRVPKARVPYGAMSKESVRDILVPMMRSVLEDAPPDLGPRYIEAKKEYHFQNGSFIKFVGCNQEPDAMRGPYATAVFLTECAFYRRLEYVHGSVVMPMLMGQEGAFLVMGSSPPESPSHEWSTHYVAQAKREGVYVHRTIEDNPRLSDGEREAFIRRAGGRESTKCRRELFAEHVTEESRAIVPEFGRAKDAILVEHPRPSYFVPMVAMDVGFNDHTVAALGYHDFANDLAVIEADVHGAKERASVIDRRVAEMELELWPRLRVTRRYVDADPIVIAELMRPLHDPTAWWNQDDVPEELRQKVYRDGGRTWIKTRNDELQASVNALRTQIGAHRYRIHPRAARVAADLEHGVWKETAAAEPRQFDRSGKHGHFDGLSALMYFERNLNRRKNPYPALPSHVTEDTHHIPRDATGTTSDAARTLARALRPSRRAWG